MLMLKGGTHPLVVKYNQLYNQALEVEREFEEVKRKAEAPKAKYRITKVAKQNPQHFNRIEGAITADTELYSFYAECYNRDELDAFIHYWGSGPGNDKQLRSVEYYRVNGVLVHGGGGHCLFQDPIPCSDEQWEMLKKGIIPQGWKVNWNVESMEVK